MKKTLRVLLIIGLILTLIGGLEFVVGFASTGWDYKALGSMQVETLRYTEKAENPLTSLTLDYENADVSVTIDETAESVIVDYPQLQDRNGKLLSEVTLTETDGGLSISEKVSDWKFGMWDFTDPKVYITLPASRVYALAITTDNGDIKFTGAGQTSSVTVNTDNGDVKITSLVCENAITLTTDNGNMVLENISAKTLTVETNNGDVSLQGNILAEHIAIETDNGDITAKNGVLDGKVLIFESDNGDVKLQLTGSQADYAVLVETDNGKSNLSPTLNASPNARNLKITTDNGDIHVTFTEE